MYPTERVQAVTAARRVEQQQMRNYATTDECRMRFLTRLLDDASSMPCGVCDVCAEQRFRGSLDLAEVAAARLYLRQGFITIEPRKRLVGHGLPEAQRFETGRALCAWSDRGWGTMVMTGRHDAARFDDRVVGAAVDMIREWAPEPMPTWVAFVPSIRHPLLVEDLARRIGAAFDLPVLDVVRKVRDTPQQTSMRNSAHQHANVDGAFEISGVIHPGPVLLVDDLVDSRWTFTEVAKRLRLAGAGQVFPLALASTMGRDS
jgi:ATP-dependent DNA helicase RecQ